MKSYKLIDITEAKELIVKLAAKPIQRKELVEKCIAEYVKGGGLSPAEQSDKTPGAPLNIVKCRFGDAIEQLLQSSTLVQNPDKTLCLREETDIDVNRDEIIEKCILEIVEEGDRPKKSMIGEIIKRTKGVLNAKPEVIRADAGRILSGLVKNNQIALADNMYAKIKPPESAAEKNARLLGEISDEALVVHSVAMLEKWYTTVGYSDVVGLNTDGPRDGGIDGRITATDPLGFKDTILLQVKNYHNPKKQVPECELREFCGVLSAEPEATKGLFVTSRKYHNDSIKFAKKYKQKYLVLIDGELWQKLALECGYEINN